MIMMINPLIFFEAKPLFIREVMSICKSLCVPGPMRELPKSKQCPQMYLRKFLVGVEK